MQNLPLLTQQAVRDLAWAVFAPSLIDDYRFHPDGAGVENGDIPLTTQRVAWLMQLDQQPSKLLDAISRLKSTRLGIYFEALWQFFLSADPQFELLATNLRVYSDIYRKKQTLGEFDVLLLDRSTEAFVHLELACKYFLDTQRFFASAQGGINLSNWRGPNSRDRLDLKLQHLLNHQIRLSERPESRQLLARHHIDTLRKQIAIKGYLFYPSSGEKTPGQNPYPLTPEHCRGRWFYLRDFISRYDRKVQWRILPRRQWLSPAQVDAEDAAEKLIAGVQLPSALAQHFVTPLAPPLMLCAMEQSAIDFRETSRCMVTGPNWPNPD